MKFVIDHIFSKYSGWEHEKEFRLVLLDCNNEMDDYETIKTSVSIKVFCAFPHSCWRVMLMRVYTILFCVLFRTYSSHIKCYY